MNGNARAKVEDFSQTIISTVQISSLGFSDTHFKVGYLQIFSVIRGLSPTRKSEKFSNYINLIQTFENLGFIPVMMWKMCELFSKMR